MRKIGSWHCIGSWIASFGKGNGFFAVDILRSLKGQIKLKILYCFLEYTNLANSKIDRNNLRILHGPKFCVVSTHRRKAGSFCMAIEICNSCVSVVQGMYTWQRTSRSDGLIDIEPLPIQGMLLPRPYTY